MLEGGKRAFYGAVSIDFYKSMAVKKCLCANAIAIYLAMYGKNAKDSQLALTIKPTSWSFTQYY